MQLQRVSTVNSAIGSLRTSLREGMWAPGDRLPSEAALTKMMGISRASLREAIRALAHSGLLAVRQGDGTYVVAIDESDTAMRRLMTESHESDLLEVRHGLDVIAVRLASMRRDEIDLKRMRKALRERQVAWDCSDAKSFAEADSLFHLAVAQAAHNTLLSGLYASVADVLRHSLGYHMGERNESHEDLYEAIVAQDSQRAAEAALTIIVRQAGQEA